MKVGDLIKVKKYGTLGVVIRIQEAAQVDDTQLYVFWVNSGKKGMCWEDEVENLSASR